MKSILTLIVLATLFFSCSKKEENKETYTISGIHEIRFDNYLSSRMLLGVEPLTGVDPALVTLSVEGLPKDIRAILSSESGIPGFTCELSFEKSDTIDGVYNVNIVSSSQGKKKLHPFVINIPALSGIRFGGHQLQGNNAYVYLARADSLIFTFNQYRFVKLVLIAPQGGLPKQDGFYEYAVTDYADTRAGRMPLSVSYSEHFDDPVSNYTPDYFETKKVKIEIRNGYVVRLSMPYIKVSPYGIFYSPESKSLAFDIN